MLRILIKPTTFTVLPIQDGQNPYINSNNNISTKKALEQHKKLSKVFKNSITVTVDDVTDSIPDIVFSANSALCLPRLGRPLLLLPYMKYKQRRNELKYLKKIFNDLELDTLDYPGGQSAPFEGQAELKWFNGGTKAICGYGHRSTKKSFEIIDKLFNKIYKSNNLSPPELLVIKLESPDYYHLDVAMLEFDDRCVIHKKSFSDESINKIRDFLGDENVFVIDTDEKFCLNAVIDGDKLITNLISRPLKTYLEKITHRKNIMVDTSEFQKSGGSVRCMTLDIFN
jgi:N-dimethylarginine dimethylaminohydrolase